MPQRIGDLSITSSGRYESAHEQMDYSSSSTMIVKFTKKFKVCIM